MKRINKIYTKLIITLSIILSSQYVFSSGPEDLTSRFNNVHGNIYYSNSMGKVQFVRVGRVGFIGTDGLPQGMNLISENNKTNIIEIFGKTDDITNVTLKIVLPEDITSKAQIKGFENCEKLAQSKMLLGINNSNGLLVAVMSQDGSFTEPTSSSLTGTANSIQYQMVIGQGSSIYCSLTDPSIFTQN